MADPISYGVMEITTPGFALSSADNATLTNASSVLYPGYTLSAEFCENSSCASPTTLPVGDQSLLRFTDMTLTCDDASGCGLIDIRFEALNAVEFSAPTPAGVVNVDLNLDGSATQSIVGSATLCIAGPHAICTADLSGTHSFTTSFDGPFSGSVSGAVPTSPGLSVYGQIEIDALGNGQTVTLTNSLDIGTDVEPALGSGTTPEPGTLALTAAPMLLLLGLRLGKSRKLRPPA